MRTNAAEGVLQRNGSDMVSNEMKNCLQIDLEVADLFAEDGRIREVW